MNLPTARQVFQAKVSMRTRRPRVLEVSVWFFLLVAVGRIGQLVPGLGRLPLAKVAVAFAVCAIAARWRSLPRINHVAKPVVRMSLALLILAVLSVPFSIWVGKSVAFVYRDLPALFAGVAIVYKLSYDWPSLRRMYLALVMSGAALSFATLLEYTGGRASVATMYDTNDLAYVLVTVAPLALAFALTEQSPRRRLFFVAVCLAFVITILLTASRGGLFGLLMAAGVIVVSTGKPVVSPRARATSLRRTVLLGLVCACFGLAVWPFLPTATQQRLATVVNLGSDYNLNPNDVGGRSEIWKRGLRALEQRPWGYGADSYEMVDLKFGGTFKAPHDSVLQISVELGVLAGVLLLLIYLRCYTGLGRARRALVPDGAKYTQEQVEQSIFSRMLQASLLGNFVSGAFLSMAYATVFWIAVALAMGSIGLMTPRTRASKAVRRWYV